MLHAQLIEKLKNRQARIAIIGLGYVGLPLSLRYVNTGYPVLGIDIDPLKISKIHSGKSYLCHVSDESIFEAVKKGWQVTGELNRIAEADAIILCLPTPLSKQREPDLSFILETTDALLPFLRSGQIFSLESTTYPGTTDEELLPRIAATGKKIGEDFFLVYSPEREDPGNLDYRMAHIPKICGGITSNCLAAGIALYQQITNEVIPVSSTRVAEMTKLLENIHRAVNIGLVNEIKILTDKMGIDVYEVIHAAATKPFGFVPYYPGPGIGGHCIPVDPFYLTWKAHEYGFHTRFIELAGEINNGMPLWVIQKLTDALNNCGKPLKNSKVLILGIAYKKNVDDVRESPAVKIMEFLKNKEVIVSYSDPHFPTFPKMREHYFDLKSLDLTADALGAQDAVLLTTAHDQFDYEFIKENAQLIVDTRGVFRMRDPKIIRA